MLSQLCVIAAVLVASWLPSSTAWRSCAWTRFEKQNILGGEAVDVQNLKQCQDICEQRIDTCQSLDFNEATNGCWLLRTQDGKQPNQDITHYDLHCQEIDPCEFEPCANGGVCSPSGQTYQCSCPPGYSGNSCEKYDPCFSSPCHNGGVCSAAGNDYQCSCPTGYSGKNCDNYDPCASSPCHNGGVCSAVGSDYQCSCPTGYSGKNCDNYDPCASSPCHNGGVCSAAGSDYQCSCPTGYSGKNCDIFDPCALSPCRNGGVCSAFGTDYQCSCPTGYSGKNCDNYNPCVSSPCLNGGVCSAVSNGYQCSCPPGYSGTNCEKYDPCSSSPCFNGGVCSAVGNSYQCSCQPGYTGSRCETFNPCATSPCQNGGACSVVGSSYQCSCPSNYFGTNCETFNPCTSSLCQNGGTCSATSTGYTCACRVGYFGTNCQYYNPCAPNPCANGGQCTPMIPGYQCACPAGWSGTNCQISGGGGTNPCSSAPCLNGGTCSVVQNSYICACRSGFTGSRCEASGGYRDIFSISSDPRCFKTNYQGSVSDFYANANGATINYGAATFGFDWPQANLIIISVGSTVDQITLGGADNLAYFRIVLSRNSGAAVTSRAITANDRSVDLGKVTNVRRVDFYLVPNDYRRNITLYDVSFKSCSGLSILQITCSLFDLLGSIITVGTLGIIRPGGVSGSFTASIEPSLPYIELDLGCTGVGTVAFSQIKFDRITNVASVLVSVWNGASRVTVFRNDGVAIDTFNPSVPIALGSGVIGNRIRIGLVPSVSSNQPISGSVWFARLQIIAG